MINSAALLLATAISTTRPDVAFEGRAEQYFKAGQYDRALDLANRSLENALREDPGRPRYLLARARACIEMDEPGCASAALDEAQPIAEAAHDSALLAHVHRERGFWLTRFDKNRAAALREFDTALTLGREAHAWDMVITTLHMSANVLRGGSDAERDEAVRRYEEALPIARRERWGTAHILKNLGESYRSMGRFAEAAANLRAAADEADRNGIAEIRWQTRLGLALIARDSDPAAAERWFGESLDLIEEQQSGVLLDDFRPGVLAIQMRWANPYDEFIDFLLAHDRSADALFVAERQRARVFLEELSAARDHVRTVIPKGFAEAEGAALAHLRAAQSALRDPAISSVDRARRIAEVSAIENQLTGLKVRLAVEQPSVAQARYPKLSTVHEIQSKLLRDDEAMLAFYLGSKRSVAWLIARNRFTTFDLPPAAAIRERVQAALDEMRSPAGTGNRAAEELARSLSISRIVDDVHEGHLLVVPHGMLNDVPFEPLPLSDGRPLVERVAIAYVPSASSLAFLRQRQPEPVHRLELLALADPIVPGPNGAARRQFNLSGINLLAPLPHTSDEVTALAKLFGSRAKVLLGDHATRAELESAFAEKPRIVHFATHGLIDETDPDRSGLLLTAASPRDDGLLQVRDIYGLHLDAQLVTLSACETARGRQVTGEGIIGLTRAFFFAGAQSVVASLWDVDDDATSRLMQSFYRNMQRGEPIDVALQQAKIEFIHDKGATAAPFFWAAFVVSGDAQSLIAPPRRIPIASWLAGLATLAALAYWRMAKARRRDATVAAP